MPVNALLIEQLFLIVASSTNDVKHALFFCLIEMRPFKEVKIIWYDFSICALFPVRTQLYTDTAKEIDI